MTAGRYQLIIREFQTQDTDQVVSLWQACELTVPWNDPVKDIARKAQVFPELFLVGVVEENVVASIMGGYDGHRGWINYLAVKPQMRGRHYGERLVQAVEARLLKLGCPKINLQIRASNTGVIRFYQQQGFTEDDCVSMGKRLIPDE